MARPRKVREGAASAPSYAAIVQGSEAERRADPTPGNNGDALSRIVAFFAAEYPTEWDAMQRGPLAFGLSEMAAILKARGS